MTVIMYFKLAFKNIKKSYKNYVIYFLTLIFGICIFYTFNSIQSQTNETAKTTKKAEQIVLTQEQALQDTINVFGSINNLVEDLVLELDKIKQYVAGMESARNDTLDSIQNISAVSEESAAASEEVSATAISQSEEIEQLAGAAEGLTNDAQVLQEAIGKFKI